MLTDNSETIASRYCIVLSYQPAPDAKPGVGGGKKKRLKGMKTCAQNCGSR